MLVCHLLSLADIHLSLSQPSQSWLYSRFCWSVGKGTDEGVDNKDRKRKECKCVRVSVRKKEKEKGDKERPRTESFFKGQVSRMRYSFRG